MIVVTYYIGNVPFGGNDIQHHGIKGMKWGIRRYQNPDGTLTAEGKARLKDTARRTLEGNSRLSGLVPGLSGGSMLNVFSKGGRRGFQERRAESRQAKADKLKAEGKEWKAEKMQEKADAQRRKNADVDKYVRSLSPQRILLQNVLNPTGGSRYREERAMGRSAVGAWVDTNLFGGLPGVATRRNLAKKKYGAAAWSAMDD